MIKRKGLKKSDLSKGRYENMYGLVGFVMSVPFTYSHGTNGEQY